jgi:hypothetical protein
MASNRSNQWDTRSYVGPAQWPSTQPTQQRVFWAVPNIPSTPTTTIRPDTQRDSWRKPTTTIRPDTQKRGNANKPHAVAGGDEKSFNTWNNKMRTELKEMLETEKMPSVVYDKLRRLRADHNEIKGRRTAKYINGILQPAIYLKPGEVDERRFKYDKIIYTHTPQEIRSMTIELFQHLLKDYTLSANITMQLNKWLTEMIPTFTIIQDEKVKANGRLTDTLVKIQELKIE